jgi:hypothetical protein
MSQKLLEVYKTSTIALAHSVVVNHPHVGMSINKMLKEKKYGVYTNEHNRSTWKMYLNMAGLYHQYDHDQIHKINVELGLGLTDPTINRSKMIIRVAGDSGQLEREFTVENISSETADVSISKEYQPGSRAYNELVGVYSEFENLIQGILHPIPLDVSTNADEYEVLHAGGYYKTRLDTLSSQYAYIKSQRLVDQQATLIEDWEESLVGDINHFTKNFFRQHYNPVYGEFNDLYVAQSLGLYYLNLPTLIMQLRLNKVKTRETHSTHVQLYLDSFSGLGQYISYLTRDQVMFLYRNLDWLIANFGKQKTFDILLDVLIYSRRIPAIFYNSIHRLENMPGQLEPDTRFTKEYGLVRPIGDGKTTLTPEEMVEMIINVAKHNSQNVDYQLYRIEDLSLKSNSNWVKTKLVHTKYTDWGMQVNGSYEEFLFCNWVYSAMKGEFTGLVTVFTPYTNNSIQLTIKNALIMFLFSYAKGYLGKNPNLIKSLYVHNIPKTIAEIDGGENLRGYISDSRFTEQEYLFLRSKSPDSRRYNSTSQFLAEIEQQWRNYVERTYAVYKGVGIRANGQMDMVAALMYHNAKIDIDLGMSYQQWLAKFGIRSEGEEVEYYQLLCNSVYEAVLFPAGTKKDRMEKTHRALINILRFFSSYSIQFITETNSSEVVNVGTRDVRLEHISTSFTSKDDIFIARYPTYFTKAKAVQESSFNGHQFSYWSSDERDNHLTQEQLRYLILTEQNDGILIKGGDV